MAGLAGISIHFLILHVAEVPLNETDIEVLLGEAEGDKVEAVEVQQGEAEGVTVEADEVLIGEAEGEVSLGEEYWVENEIVTKTIITTKELAENSEKVKALEKENGDLHSEQEESKDEVHYLKNKLNQKYDMLDDLEHDLDKKEEKLKD